MKLKKLMAVMLVLTLAMTLMIGCQDSGGQGAGEVNIYTWSAYVPQSVIQGFTEKTGIKVNYTNFQTNEEMLSKLQTSKGGDYDIVIASDYIVKLAADENLIKEMDVSKIPNSSNIDPAFQGFFYDQENKYTIPYGPGIPLIVYNPEMVEKEITGYESLWDESLKDNIALMDNERVITGIALKTLGESFNTEDLDTIQQAGDKLLELTDNIRLLSVDQTQDHLLSGEVGVGFLYTSQVIKALQGNPDLKVVYPEEGIGFGVDAAFIPVNAPNSNQAHAFLNYILEGEVSAEIYTEIEYFCPNKAAFEFLSDEFKENLVITAEDVEKGEFIKDINAEALELHDLLWTEFQSKLK